MSTGRRNKLIGQTGEYLVAAELSRRGLIATTFTGNVPDYDIIASNEMGKHVSVQVKASSGASWQFGDITRFCEIAFKGHRQIVGRHKRCPVQRLVVIFVKITPDARDQYYILTWRMLRDLLVKAHISYMEKHGGMRPKTWNSLHSAITEKALQPYRNRWAIIMRMLR
jgi:Holliday junction resolvase-like predicted endonuclease